MKFIKDNIYIIIFLFLFVFLCVLSNIKNFEIKWNERKYLTINNNLYYQEELFDYKAKDNDKNNLLNDYEILSKYVFDNYGSNIYISNFNYDDLDNNMNYYGYQVIDGVIIEDRFFISIIGDGIVRDFYFSSLGSFYDEKDFSDELVGVSSIVGKINELIEDNKKRLGDVSSVDGEYYLIYSDNKLLYRFLFTNGSYIDVDAFTGKVVKENYFDGIYH